jgi:CRP-like cAMP-binding protein
MDNDIVLRKFPLFKVLPDDIVAALSERLERIPLEESQLLFRAGDPSDALYILESGEIEVFLEGSGGTENPISTVMPGRSLGQMTLLDGDPRTAGARVAAPGSALVLYRDAFLEVLEDVPDAIVEKLRSISGNLRLGYVDLLRKLPFFAGLPSDTIMTLSSQLERTNLEQDEVLFRKGDPGDALYIIESGSVKIYTEDTDGEELVLNELGAGEAFGEMSIIDNAPRVAGVAALEPTSLLKLKRDEFLVALNEYPQISLDMIRVLTNRLRFTVQYIQQTIEVTKQIAEGDYSFARQNLESQRVEVATTEAQSDDLRIQDLLASFFSMIEGVQQREEELKAQVQRLSIEIDQAKRKEEVDSITKTDFFVDLQEIARQMREEDDD